MIKPDSWIRAWGQGGGVEPFAPEQVNSASYDVRVSDHWICPTRDPEEFRAPHIKLFPGEVVLACTLEFVKVPHDVACDLKLKSTLGRLWINHSLAGWCDPGFEGDITLELQNLGPEPFVLEAGPTHRPVDLHRHGTGARSTVWFARLVKPLSRPTGHHPRSELSLGWRHRALGYTPFSPLNLEGNTESP